MKSAFYTLLLLFTGSCIGSAQTSDKQAGRHTVYAELLGNAYTWSVNYDYLLYRDSRIKLSTGAGLGYVPFRTLKGPAIPIQLTLMYHRETAHHLEIGTGFTYFRLTSQQRGSEPGQTLSETRNYYILSPRIGYAYRKKEGGLFLRAAVLPTFRIAPAGSGISAAEKDAFLFARTFSVWCGIGAGYTF